MYRSLILIIGCFLLATPSAQAYVASGWSAQLLDPSNVLTVEMYGDTAASVPPGSQRVRMGTLRLRASCGRDIPVRGITLWHRGLGDHRDIEAVYAVSEGRRLTRGRHVRHDGRISLRLRRFIVPSCGTKDIIILTDFSSDAAVAGEHWFELQRGIDIESRALVLIDRPRPFPLRRTVGRKVGTVLVDYLSLTEPIRYGEHQRVARFRLSADAIDHHSIRSITFTNNGSASDADLQNLFIESSRGERLTNYTYQMDGDQVLLIFEPPLILQRNQQRVFSLRADVRASRRRTVQFVVEESGDIEAKIVLRRVRR